MAVACWLLFASLSQILYPKWTEVGRNSSRTSRHFQALAIRSGLTVERAAWINQFGWGWMLGKLPSSSVEYGDNVGGAVIVIYLYWINYCVGNNIINFATLRTTIFVISGYKGFNRARKTLIVREISFRSFLYFNFDGGIM